MTTPNEVTDGDLAAFCQMLGIYGTHFKGGSIVKSALQKIVDKHAAKAQAEPDAWRIFNGEGGYDYREDEPTLAQIAHARIYGRTFETCDCKGVVPAPAQGAKA